MVGEWRDITVGDLAPFVYGKGLPEGRRNANGHFPVYGSNGVIGFHDAPLTGGPTIVIGRKGTVGAVHYSPAPCWPIDTTFFISGSDPLLVRYCYYVLKSLGLEHMNADSAVPGLNRDAAHARRVRVPLSENEQRAIAGVLGALDDKIELNRRMSKTLEAMARAIFRAWFVDFEPVKAKAEGATSFPSMPQPVFDALPTRFVDSEIGPVPEGWGVKPIGQTFHLTMGQSPSSEFYNQEGNGLPFHQGVTDYGFRFPTHRVYCTAEGRLAEPRDILFSVRTPVGRINVADRRLMLGRGLAGLRHSNDRQSFLLQQLVHVFAEEDAIGDGTIYRAVTKQVLSNIPLLVPTDNVQQAFEHLARPLDDLIAASEVETCKLAELRDYLLPKLLSGEVRVKDAERLMEATS